MTQFSITITDPAHLAGIASARAAFNAGLALAAAQGVEGEEGYVPAQALEDHPDFIATDEAYIQFVMSRASESYSRQYGHI